MALSDHPSERGSVIIFLFIALGLLAALSFTFLQGSRGSVSMLQAEQSDAAATASQDCTNTVNMAMKRLELRGCGSMISYLADGSNANTDAPTDGSCSVFHPNGGGAKACNASAIAPCDMTTLLPGQTGCGVVYVGISGGKRIYTSPTDQSAESWSNGTSTSVNTGATQWNDGMANTNLLIGLSNADSPYKAANSCRTLGAEWYLPTLPEGYLLATSTHIGDLDGTFADGAQYWTSVQQGIFTAYFFVAGTDFVSGSTSKNAVYKVRCVRSD